MELSGAWRAIAATDETRRTFHLPELDDRDWADVIVPGHWSSHPQFVDNHAVLYRTRFTHSPTTPTNSQANQSRHWLCLDGICQQGDVWLNGQYVGTTDGYFVPHSFDISKELNNRSEHLLAIDVNCGPHAPSAPTNHLLGSVIDPELCGIANQNPGGIWQPVRIRETKSTAIRYFRIICEEADTKSARLAMRCVFHTPTAQNVLLRTRVAGHEHELQHPAAAGENRVEWQVQVPAPRLWWPHSLGDQPLYGLRCEVIVDGEVSDNHEARIGFRSVSMRNWALRVNGERLFVKGTGMLSTSARPADATPEQVAADVLTAKSAGLDMIRLITHVARREVYRAADEVGMMLWQDLPLRGEMSRNIKTEAKRQTREAVDLLGHPPSVLIWCVHDEPFKQPTTPTATPPVITVQRPSWNRSVLDRSLRRVLNRTDGSRPLVTHTAVPPNLGDFDGTTSHLWFGWHRGRAADLVAAAARVPRMVRFVSAFGAASVNPSNPYAAEPAAEGAAAEGAAAEGVAEDTRTRWPELDWERIALSVGATKNSLLHLAAPSSGGNASEWVARTQTAQAEVLKTAIESLRRLKYRPTGGFLAFYLADPTDAGGFGVLDHNRVAKPAWQSLVDACRPLIVVADPLPQDLTAGEDLDVAVHVVSDLRLPIEDARVQATLRANISGGGSVVVSEQIWVGTILPDSCSFIGRINAPLPSTATQAIINLSVTANDVNITNTYQSSTKARA
ncbi:MAG: hypothetical protein KTU85_06070 [Acidimicrobiia bacterium]|nr:hypothetical protein [Acidimicrobiia bacterium]